MDIKDLDKTQLIFLALLLSFVASIATSITTVSLMQQAPTSVTVPINRVIQQTVEKIQQVEGKTTVQTVVVKEEDLVVDAIAKNQSSIFTITKNALDETGNIIEVGAGKGFVLNNDGLLAVDSVLVPEQGTYFVKNDSGKFKAEFIGNEKAGFSFLKIGKALDEKNTLAFKLPVFGDMDTMKAGQSIIFLGSGINTFTFDGNKDIKLGVNKSSAGGMVINLNGEVIGMASFSESPSFVSINSILDALKAREATTVKTP